MKWILTALALLAGTAGAQNVSSWTNNVLALSGSAAPLALQMDLPMRVAFKEYSGPSVYDLTSLSVRWELLDNRDSLAVRTGTGNITDATNGTGSIATTITGIEAGGFYLLRISAWDDVAGEKAADLALHDVTLTAYCADCPGGSASVTVSNTTIIASGAVQVAVNAGVGISNLTVQAGDVLASGGVVVTGVTVNAITQTTIYSNMFTTLPAYQIPYGATVTLDPTNGYWQTMAPTAAVTLAIADSLTGSVGALRLDLFAGSQAITFVTTTVSRTTSLLISTSAVTSILFDSPIGKTVWDSFQLR